MTMKTRSMNSKIEVACIMASISKTDKNNKRKKRKMQQTLSRKVDRALKTQPVHDFEEPQRNCIYKTLEQVSQIT